MPQRRLAILVTVVATAVALAGCNKARTAAQTSPTANFGILVSSVNGLYYPPFLRDETSGPEANSYAVRLRKLLGRNPPQLSVPDETAAFWREDAIGASALWGRLWLGPLAAAGVAGALTPADADTLHHMRTADGYYAEPAAEPAAKPAAEPESGSKAGTESGEPDTATGNDYRAAATAAALETLGDLDAITADDREKTGAWLDRRAATRPPLREAADLAAALHTLGLPVPRTLGDTTKPVTVDASMDDQGRYQALLDAYAITRLDTALHRRTTLDPATWSSVLAHNGGTLGYQDLYYLVVVAKAAGVPDSEFAAVRARLAGETLPDNSVRDSSELTGSPEATLFVLRLRGMAGGPTTDAAQVTALRAAAAAHPDMTDSERLTLDAALVMAGDDSARKALTGLCASAVPATVTPDDAEGWSRQALACAEAGITTKAPAAKGWPMDSPDRVVAAAVLVNGLADAHLPADAGSWVTAQALHDWALNPDRIASTSGYASVARAYLGRGGTGEPATLDARKGCPGLPSLYRADGTGSGCDLKATWSVWKLHQLTEQGK